MTQGPSDLALQHLERLKTELRGDLGAIEERISDLEANGLVKKSRIELLASLLSTLVKQEDHFGGEHKRDSGKPVGQEEIMEVRVKLQGILHEVEKEASHPSQNEQLAEAYNAQRSRLMTVLNALDLAAVALRKKIELQKAPVDAPQDGQSPTPSGVARPSLGSSAIIRSQELERQRIAREIHDGPAQAIANVVLRMDILHKVHEKDPDKAMEELSKMKAIAQGALDEIRGFIFDLRPMTLQDLGLVATIKRVVTGLKDLTGLNIRLIVEGKERPLGQLVNLGVFRIAQEATTNLKKYSNCETAWVHLKFLEDKVILIIEDDGGGFDLDEVVQSQKKYASFGLLGMRERADDINAGLEITSVPGEGTKVVLVVPTEGNPALNVNWDS